MPSRSLGAAPLVSGLVLAGTAANSITNSGVTAWGVAALVGSCAAIALGVSVLVGADADAPDRPASPDGRWRMLLGVAALSIATGGVLALV